MRAPSAPVKRPDAAGGPYWKPSRPRLRSCSTRTHLWASDNSRTNFQGSSRQPNDLYQVAQRKYTLAMRPLVDSAADTTRCKRTKIDNRTTLAPRVFFLISSFNERTPRNHQLQHQQSMFLLHIITHRSL